MIPLDLPPAQVLCIEKAVHSETRGVANGPDLVVAVILNRMTHPKFPDTPCEVVYQKHQFTGIRNVGKPSKESIQATRAALENKDRLNQEVLYFHNTSVRPSWSYKLKRLLQRGKHIFYGETK